MNELRRVQTYLGLNHSDARLQQVLDRCSLKKLKADIDTRKVKTAMVDDNGKSILYRKGNTDKQTHNRRSSFGEGIPNVEYVS